MENVLTLGKLLSLWFSFLLHSILFLISQTSYRTYKIFQAMGSLATICLVNGRAKRAPHWGVQSRFCVILESAVCRIVRYSSEPNTKVYGMWPHPFKHFFSLGMARATDTQRRNKYGESTRFSLMYVHDLLIF